MKKHIDTLGRQKGLPEPKAMKYRTNSKLLPSSKQNAIANVNDKEREGTKNNYVLFHPRDSKQKKGNTNVDITKKPLSSIKPPSSLMYKSSNNDKRDQFTTSDTVNKPVYTSTLLKNVPIRAKKRIVSQMDNYCLFDPSTDFFNEREHVLGTIPETHAIETIYPSCNNDEASNYQIEEYDTIEEVDEMEENFIDSISIELNQANNGATNLPDTILLVQKSKIKQNISNTKNVSINQMQYHNTTCPLLYYKSNDNICDIHTQNIAEDLGAVGHTPPDTMTVEEFITVSFLFCYVFAVLYEQLNNNGIVLLFDVTFPFDSLFFV